jgi:hypothetical protein
LKSRSARAEKIQPPPAFKRPRVSLGHCLRLARLKLSKAVFRFLMFSSVSQPVVEFVLQAEGVRVVLDGKITYSKFESAPDAPSRPSKRGARSRRGRAAA